MYADTYCVPALHIRLLINISDLNKRNIFFDMGGLEPKTSYTLNANSSTKNECLLHICAFIRWREEYRPNIVL